MTQFTLTPVFSSYYAVVLITLVLGALCWYLAPNTVNITPKKRWTLITLRWLFLLVLFYVMLRPAQVSWETQPMSASVVFMLDSSRSMSVTDILPVSNPETHAKEKSSDTAVHQNIKSRYDAMKDALHAAETSLDRLGTRFKIHAWSYDAGLHAAPLNHGKIILPQAPQGMQTALGDSLEAVLRETTGERILGIILMGDGMHKSLPPLDTLPQIAAVHCARQEIPIYSVCFGQDLRDSMTCDAAIEDMLTDQRVFVGSELVVSGRVRLEGCANKDIPVELMVENASGKMETVAQTILRSRRVSESLPVLLSWVPDEPGEVKVALKIPEQKDEKTLTNNQLSAFVRVIKGGVKFLYIEGTVRPETSFLRRSLDSSSDFSMDVIRLDARNKKSRPKDLLKRLQSGYAAYILGDVDAEQFLPEELEALANNVSHGAGLFIMGGFHAYAAGGYNHSPLAPLFPVNMNNQPRQTPLGVILDDLHWDEKMKFTPTPAGKRHFALTLDSDPTHSDLLWQNMPFLSGANRVNGVRSGAVVLAGDEKGRPMLIEKTYGRGRVMAFTADSTWRWWMHGYEIEHKRFWRQVLLWVAQKDMSLEGDVWLTLPKRRYAAGEPVTFLATARSALGDVLKDGTWNAEIETPEGKRILMPLKPDGEHHSGTFLETLAPGDYTIYVDVKQGIQDIGKARCRFMVVKQDLELDNAAADSGLLDSLAHTTGGHSLKPDQLSTFLDELHDSGEKLDVKREIRHSLWDNWLTLLLACAFLGTEWFMRKFWGLV